MGKQTVNTLTTVWGLLMIIAAVYTVVIQGVEWFDAQFGIYAGVSLIYTKNSSIMTHLKEFNQNKRGKDEIKKE